jgi:hypothetical protein
MTITTTHKLLTPSWAPDVEAVETAVGRFKADRVPDNDCQVVLFEMVRDGHLHVNVTHKYPTKSAPGWMGPASLPQGFVHNRTFSERQPTGQIVRHVRDMVCAAPIGTRPRAGRKRPRAGDGR